ncbi:YCII-related domain-containing protein [Salinibacterium sp. NYA9b]
MAKFLFLYKGFEQPTPEIGAAWMSWFGDVGDAMIDPGSPLSPGVEVTRDAVTPLEFGLEAFTGYSIIEAADKDAAVALAKTNPMITSVMVYELGSM